MQPKRTVHHSSSKSQTNLKAKIKKIMSTVEIIKEDPTLEFASPLPLSKPKQTHKVLRIQFSDTKCGIDDENLPEKKSHFKAQTTKNVSSRHFNDNSDLNFENGATFSDLLSLQSEVSSMNFETDNCFSFNNFSKDSMGIIELEDNFSRIGLAENCQKNDENEENDKNEPENISYSLAAFQEIKSPHIKFDYSPGLMCKENQLVSAAIKIQKHWKRFATRRNYLYYLRKYKICEIMLELIEGRKNDEKNSTKIEKFQDKLRKVQKAEERVLEYIRTGRKSKKGKPKKKKKVKTLTKFKC